MKKKISILLLALIIVLSACKTDNKENSKQNDNKNIEQKTEINAKKENETNKNTDKNEKKANDYKIGSFKFSLPANYELNKSSGDTYEATYDNKSIILQVNHSKHSEQLTKEVLTLASRMGVMNNYKKANFKEADKYKEVDIDGVKMGVQDFTVNTNSGKRYVQVAVISTKNELIIFSTATLEKTKSEFLEVIKHLYSTIKIDDSEKF